jgi:hypothetical protein
MPLNREPVAGVHSGAALTDQFRGATIATFAAMILYDALSSEQQERLTVPFDDPNRTVWNFLPEAGRGRHGIALRDLGHRENLLVHRLVAACLSLEGYARFLTIVSLEHLLRELDQPRLGQVATDFRDPGAYFLTFFDPPQPDATWGWRLVGHHVSLNFTVIGQERVVATPCLFGSEPGRFGPLRPLAAEEDLGFALLASLDQDARRAAVIHTVSPPDFATACRSELGSVERPALHGDGRRDVLITPEDAEALRWERDRPRGLAVADMGETARERFRELLGCYLGRVPAASRTLEEERIEAADFDRLHFAWAGAEDYEGGHYYRIEGPVTLIEFNNTEGDANHIHSVWRDPDLDFARELLGGE